MTDVAGRDMAVADEEEAPSVQAIQATPLLTEELLQSARQQLANSRNQPEAAAPDVDGSPPAPAHVVHFDVDLSNRGISELPEELIDVIKDEVNRLALRRNHLTGLSGLSPRISECTNLKYLVLKRNKIREFPPAILTLPNLNYVDLMDNKIEIIPDNLPVLKNLRVCALSRNRIRTIPTTLAQMQIHILDVTRNPIKFPPMEAWASDALEDPESRSGSGDHMDKAKRMTETGKIMAYLKEVASKNKLRSTVSESEQSESNAETPRPKRRPKLPLRYSVSSNVGFEHPASSRPHSPLPPRPGLVKAHTMLHNLSAVPPTRPGITPLMNGNERNRSNSESFMVTTTKRERRRGIMSKDPKLSQDLETVQDPTSFRLSHLRGASYASALPHGTTLAVNDSPEQTSPIDSDHARPKFETRLSSLPEDKRKSRAQDPLPAFARTMLYALRQITIPTVNLLGTLKEDGFKVGPLERSCARASHTLDELRRHIDQIEYESERDVENGRRRMSSNVHLVCEHSVTQFIQVCQALRSSIETIVERCDRRYVRTLMHLLFASSIEVQNACKKLGNFEFQFTQYTPERIVLDRHEKQSSPAEMKRPATSLRSRPGQPLPLSNYQPPALPSHHSSQHPSVSTLSRTASTASFTPATPFSTDSFIDHSTAPTTRSNSNAFSQVNQHFMEVSLNWDEHRCEAIKRNLNKACRLALEAIPTFIHLLDSARARAHDTGNDPLVELYNTAHRSSKDLLHKADQLEIRIMNFDSTDRQSRDSPDFWQQAKMFTGTFVDLKILAVKLIREHIGEGAEGKEIKRCLRRLAETVKSVAKDITASPWKDLAGKASELNNVKPADTHAPLPYINGHTRNNSSRQHGYQSSHFIQPSLSLQPSLNMQPSLTLQTSGPFLPADPMDPQSAASNVSSGPGIGSGHGTPLMVPATPMSAALGHAASATVPGSALPTPVPALSELPDSANGNYFASSNGSSASITTVIDRSQSVSQRR